MPTVSVYEDDLSRIFGTTVTPKMFDELCFEFGLELDEVTSEFEQMKNEQGAEKAKGLSTRVIYKIDVPANRYDLLCLEGLTTALRIFRKQQAIPNYRWATDVADPKMTMTVSAETTRIRPFVVCAILRNITFDESRYQSFIDLQDKLHHNICRRRQLVAIGTHDLDTIEGPFTYEALKPEDIEFIPLNQTEKMNGKRLMEFYSSHQQLKAYLPIIRDSEVYPVIYDSKRRVLSLPPIINGDHSKISINTKNVFIECTANDLTKAKVTLNTIIAMFSGYCENEFTCEPVNVVYSDEHQSAMRGQTVKCPALQPQDMTADAVRMAKGLALEHLTPAEVRDYLQRMSVPCSLNTEDPTKLDVRVPITRSDIMHECDLMEDLAIAYGYNNLVEVIPQVACGGSEQPINHLTDLMRHEFAAAGFSEALNWGLVSTNENFTWMKREPTDYVPESPDEYNPFAKPVVLENPKTREFQIVRSSLLPGLLKTMACNKHNSPPIKLFEVSDVTYISDSVDTGAQNYRRCAALYMGQTAGFDVVHGLLDQIMWKLDCVHETQPNPKGKRVYKLENSTDPAFFDGFRGDVVVDNVRIGVIGVLHPEVLAPFEIQLPCSAIELNLEVALKWWK